MPTYYVMLARCKILVLIGTVILCIPLTLAVGSVEYCSKDRDAVECYESSLIKSLPRYILYDVNPPEGFNLRRDVYMRMAVFARKMKTLGDWHLVLPPWGQLYHWQSTDVGRQDMLPWSLFFDVPSLQRFAPVMEMHEFQKGTGISVLGLTNKTTFAFIESLSSVARKLSANLYDIYHCRVDSKKLPVVDRGTVRNM